MARPEDTDDFAEFVRQTAPQLHRAALLLTGGDHHQAEDLTQATYAKVYAAWRKVRRAGNPVAYTRTIQLNTFLSSKRLRRSSEIVTDELPEDHARDSLDTTDRLDLLAGLRALPASDRAVLVARYWEDRSVAETADLLGISPIAVRSRAHRALARLRPLLADPAESFTEGSAS